MYGLIKDGDFWRIITTSCDQFEDLTGMEEIGLTRVYFKKF